MILIRRSGQTPGKSLHTYGDKWTLSFNSVGLSSRFLIYLTPFSTLPAHCGFFSLSVSTSSFLIHLPGESYSVHPNFYKELVHRATKPANWSTPKKTHQPKRMLCSRHLFLCTKDLPPLWKKIHIIIVSLKGLPDILSFQQ